MCGICGVYNFGNRAPVSVRLLTSMNDTMYRRGPDEEGYFVNGPIGLAMRRLSIIDIEGGKQPVHNEDKSVWLVFNGEIFNFRELRSSLRRKGHGVLTNSDTEVIVHLYEEFGADLVHRLRGMFSFALWDAGRHTLLLARDRVGIKPLFYSVIGGEEIVFASEIKALRRHQGISARMDLQALDAFFTYGYIPHDLTIFEGIRKLLPGHLMEVSPSGPTARKYWDIHFRPDHGKTEEAFEEEFIGLFSEAVRMRLVSDVPLGAFLSGGVDSSLVVAGMARSMVDAPKTFTVGFGDACASHIDERPYARMLAGKYGCDHHEITVEPKIDEILDDTVLAFDEPFADDSVIPTSCICESARREVTVALTGLGGDELFCGYERYLGLRLSEFYDSVSGAVPAGLLARLVASLPEQKNGGYFVNHAKRFFSASSLPLPRRYLGYVSALTGEERKQLFSPDVRRLIDFDATEDRMTALYTGDNASTPLDRAVYQDIKTYLPEDILALTDRVGMFHSLELRMPFTDHVLMEFCATIPAELKIRRLKKKYLLRKAASRFVPAGILSHRKQGFSSPIARWLKDDLRPLCDRLLSEDAVGQQGIFDRTFVRRAIEEHMTRKRLNDKLLFSLIMFQKWSETVERRRADKRRFEEHGSGRPEEAPGDRTGRREVSGGRVS